MAARAGDIFGQQQLAGDITQHRMPDGFGFGNNAAAAQILQNDADADAAMMPPPTEAQIVRECIDCITRWVTKYLGESTFQYSGGNINQIWGGPIQNRPSIREIVTQHINQTIEQYRQSEETTRVLYIKLINSYNSLDWTRSWERWNELKAQNPSKHNEGLVYYRGQNARSPLDEWRAAHISNAMQAAPSGGPYYGIEKYLDSIHNPNAGTYYVQWSPDESGANNVIREYFSCFINLILTFFPQYANIQPQFPIVSFGGYKQKSKRRRNRCRKTKKNKKQRRSI
jgi:hypothetical protein